MSNNLGVNVLTTGQNNKEATVNESIGRLDAALTEWLAVDVTSGNVTLTASEFQQAMLFRAHGHTVSRNLTVAAVERGIFVVKNDGTSSGVLNVVKGSTSIAMAIGTIAIFATDGTTNSLVLLTNGTSANVQALAGLTGAADTVPYFTGVGTMATTGLTSAARSVLDDTTVAAMLTTLEGVSRTATSVQFMASELHISPASGTAAQFGTNSEGLVGSSFFGQNFRASADSPSVVIRKSRGTRASPGELVQNDRVFLFNGQGLAGVQAFSMFGRVIAATPNNASDYESEVVMELNAAGSIVAARALQLSLTVGLQLFGAGLVVIDPDRVFRSRGFTVGTLPTGVTGKRCHVTDANATTFASTVAGGGANVVPVFYNGSNWIIA